MSPLVWLSAFWVAFAFAASFAGPILKVLQLARSRQTVSAFAPELHALKQGTPTMGGIIIIVGFSAGMAIGHLLRNDPGFQFSKGATIGLAGLFVMFWLFAITGFVDDFVIGRIWKQKRGLGWKQKLLMQFVASLAFAVPAFPRDLPAQSITVFLVLFFSNAFNFSDGLDGLAGSILVFLAGGLAVLAGMAGMGPLVFVLLALSGATVPFLFVNAPPAKVFMGDVGSLPIGAVLGAAVASILLGGPFLASSAVDPTTTVGFGQVTFNPSTAAALCVISLLMVVELVPVPLQILSVKLRKKRLFPFTPIHHAFEKAGWPETRVTWCFALTQLLLSVCAVTILFASGTPR